MRSRLSGRYGVPWPPRGRRATRAAFAFAIVVGLAATTVSLGASNGGRTGSEYVVIVHADNPLRELKRSQVAAYFLKRTGAWPNGTLVNPVDLPPDSRSRSAFSREVLRRAPNDVSAYWIQEIFAGRSEPPGIRNSEAAVISHVSSTPGAIGYVSSDPGSASVRVLLVTP